jgi:hypothetical protein
VLAVCGLPMGLLGWWWHIMVEAEDEFHILAVVGIEDVVFACVAKVAVVGWGCFGDAAAQAEALASAPVGEGSRRYTRASRVLLFLY